MTAVGDRCTSLEVEKEPAVAEVEVSVVSVLMHVLKQFRVEDLHTALVTFNRVQHY